MKKIFFALASFALITSANAADGSDVKFNAELWFNYYSNNQQDFSKSGTDTFWTQRTKLGAHWSKGDDLGAQLTLLSANVWGNSNPDGLLPTAATQPSNGTIAGQGYLNNGLALYEAWAFWKAMDNVVIKVGRGALDVADGTVISKNDELLTPYAFDGVLGAFYTEFAAFNFFGVKAADGSQAFQSYAKASDKESNFYGLSVDVRNLPEALKMVNIHLMEQKAYGLLSGANSVDDSKLRYGVTLKGDYMHFDYRGTYAGYTGKAKTTTGTVQTSTNESANMYDLELGYTFSDLMNLRLSGNYHADTGNTAGSTDSKHYDPFFYNLDYAGLMHVVQWGNLKYWKLGATVEPMEAVKVGLDYYSFTKNQSADQVALFWGNNASNNTDSKVGTEWDLSVNKKMSNGVNVGAFYGMFTPSKTLLAAGGDAKAFSQLGLNAKFTF